MPAPCASKAVVRDAFAANRGLQTLPVWSARDAVMLRAGTSRVGEKFGVAGSGALERTQFAVADERDTRALDEVAEAGVVRQKGVVLDAVRPVRMRRAELVGVDARVQV